MRNRFATASAFAATMAFALGACGGGSPTAPPPVVTNTPPTIDSLAVAGTRAEADQPIQVSATITDAETPLAQLTYTWSASPTPGVFSDKSINGNQTLITWRPPKGEKTPDVFTVTLTVTEAYTSGGQARQNSVSKSTTVHYNDSPAEVAALGRDFLVAKFGTFTVTPAQAVSNFSDSTQRQSDGTICSDEKATEFDQITDNRANFHILGASFLPTTPTFNAAMTNGTIDGSCQFEDIPNSGPYAGHREFVNGTCHLTTVYENFQWRLCVSNFFGSGDPTLASLKGRVPGRLRRLD